LWWRYLRNNPAFLWHIAWQLSGLRQYPRSQGTRMPETQCCPLHDSTQQDRTPYTSLPAREIGT
jgi:hypothetical protein